MGHLKPWIFPLFEKKKLTAFRRSIIYALGILFVFIEF